MLEKFQYFNNILKWIRDLCSYPMMQGWSSSLVRRMVSLTLLSSPCGIRYHLQRNQGSVKSSLREFFHRVLRDLWNILSVDSTLKCVVVFKPLTKPIIRLQTTIYTLIRSLNEICFWVREGERKKHTLSVSLQLGDLPSSFSLRRWVGQKDCYLKV